MINIKNDSTLVDAIHNLQKAGFAIFPLVPKGKNPILQNGYKQASKSPENILKWWKSYPDANIGIATGDVSGFWVLDVDGKKGESSLKLLEDKYGILPKTLEAISGREDGGRHLYFKMPSNIEIRNSASKLGSGLDIRGNGGYIIAPPSVHPNGQAYKWADDSANEMVQAPNWLLELIQNPVKEKSSPTEDWKELIKGIPEGQRNDAITRISGALLGHGIDTDTALEICLGLNDSRFNPPLDYEEIVQTFESISQRHNNQEKTPDMDDLEILSMSDVTMEKVKWLWPDRIARGKISVVAGPPGLGKSQITANITATVTSGGNWPDNIDASQAQGNVIILSAEDDVADTIKPRLVAAGADEKYCHVLKAVRDKESLRSFDLKRDVESLDRAIKKIGAVSLIIIDPISAYMGKTDSNNNSDVRGLLSPLSDMAAENDVAVLLVTHFNKSQSQDPISKIIGSIGVVAAARAAYIVVKNELTPEKRHFVPVKNNIGNDHNGFSFHIEGVRLEGDIQTSKVCWGEQVDTKDVLTPISNGKMRSEAEEFLLSLLMKGPALATEIQKLGKEAGFSESQLNRAKQNIGIGSRKLDFDGGPWEWYYFDPEDTSSKKVLSSMPSTSSIKQTFTTVTLMSK